MTGRKGQVKERLSDVMPVRMVDQVAAKLALDWSVDRICTEYKVTPKYVAIVALWLEATSLDLPVAEKALLSELVNALRRHRRIK